MAEEAADVDAVAVSLPHQEDIGRQQPLAKDADERASQEPSQPPSAEAKPQDIALVNGQKVPNTECRLEGIFEPRPSTSSTPSPRATAPNKRSMSLAVDSTSERRQRLALMPRTTQYEKHSLLQDRSGDGLTELEAFLMEKEQPRSSLALVPRGAHYETHALLVKKSSGLTELEHYLQEKEAEMVNPTPEHRRHSDPAAAVVVKQRLEPRTSQYQAHALLESKDEEGLTLIDHLLNSEEDDDDDKGKCSLRCTCKNARCAHCKNEGNSSSSGASSPRDQACNPGLDTQLASTKHVHFDGKKDSKETSNTQSNVDSSATDSKCWKASSAKKKQQKEGGGAAVNNARNDVIAKVKKSDSHKRSCAIS